MYVLDCCPCCLKEKILTGKLLTYKFTFIFNANPLLDSAEMTINKPLG